MVRFHAEQPALVTVESNGALAPGFSHGLPAEADVERGAEFRERIPVFDPSTRKCHGTRDLPPSEMPGCGERSGKVAVMLGYTPQSIGGDPPDEGLVPLSGPNELRFRGISRNFGGGSLLGAYPTCPLQEPDINYPATRGELFEAIGHLSEKRLLSVRPHSVITVSASKIDTFKLPHGGYGQTAVAYNLKLRVFHIISGKR